MSSNVTSTGRESKSCGRTWHRKSYLWGDLAARSALDLRSSQRYDISWCATTTALGSPIGLPTRILAFGYTFLTSPIIHCIQM